MTFADRELIAANDQQNRAARDNFQRIRLVSGPGTGKSRTIERRVAHIVENLSIPPDQVYVISFTRATCDELCSRIASYISNETSCPELCDQIKVSTMHSLALKILRRGGLLREFPSDPILLDNWEQTHIFDQEFANTHGCNKTRAEEIRLAHDAYWQTLEEDRRAEVSEQERTSFNRFHRNRTNLYNCVLPGEVIFRCVQAIDLGSLDERTLPQIQHLIVDEYQDLNRCDQRFIELLCSHVSSLFIAGDDDQSIYSFRHANPNGIINFGEGQFEISSHELTACFRCTPAILEPSITLISHNPNRLEKSLQSMYSNAVPPVQGFFQCWRFQNQRDEFSAIANSCRNLINSGMSGQESEIVILLSNRKLQLEQLTRALDEQSLPYSPPVNEKQTSKIGIRAVYCLLRICNEAQAEIEDYPAYRSLLKLLHGVGDSTSKSIADGCVQNNQNFRDLFLMQESPDWLTLRQTQAHSRMIEIVQNVKTWDIESLLNDSYDAIINVLRDSIFTGGNKAQDYIDEWISLSEDLPPEMTLEELLRYFSARNVEEQQSILDSILSRIGTETDDSSNRRIRILTMHGAKGLSGKVVFIPSSNQGIMPDYNSLRSPGDLIEKRRLFYVSLTRAKAACILSYCDHYTDSSAYIIDGRRFVRTARSQFLNEIEVHSINRPNGLSEDEISEILQYISGL